jgi:hypothetical protein
MQIRKEQKPKEQFTEEQADSLAKALLYLMGIRAERNGVSTPCLQQNP